jgi:polygalacturonase
VWWNNVDSRPQLVTIVDSTQFEITDILLFNSPFYHLRIFDSSDLNLHDFEIYSPIDSPNTDGINIDSGVTNLIADGLTIRNGDDAFAVNAFSNPSSNILFQNSRITGGHGVSIGSGVYEAISSVTFENLNISNTKYGCRIKCKNPPSNYSQDAGRVQDVLFTNISLNNTEFNPIYLSTHYGGDSSDNVQLSNITFQNFTSRFSGNNLRSEITGTQLKSPLVLDNVVFSYVTDSDPTSSLNLIENTTFQLVQPVTGVNTANS